jgi:hypothetical protein
MSRSNDLLRHKDHALHSAVQRWMDKQRDTLKVARKTTAETGELGYEFHRVTSAVRA